MSASRYRRCEDVVQREVGGEVFLFNPRGDALHVLNPTGALVWELLAEARTGLELEQALREAFELVPGDDPAADLARMLGELEARALVRAAE